MLADGVQVSTDSLGPEDQAVSSCHGGHRRCVGSGPWHPVSSSG